MKSCAACMHWRESNPPEIMDGELVGNCTRNPPQVVQHNKRYQNKSVWPLTFHYMLCGEYAAGEYEGKL